MKLRNLLITAAVLAVLTLLAFWLKNRSETPPPPDPRVGQELVTEADIAKTTRIQIQNTEGESVTLEKNEEGVWIGPDYYGLQADFDKLTRFVGSLSEGKIARRITDNPERMARLDFDGERITLSGPDGKVIVDMELGKRSDLGGKYVKFAAEDTAYLAELNLWLDASPKNWAEKRLVTYDKEDVARLEVGFENADTLEVTRPDENTDFTGVDLDESTTVKQSEINSLIDRLRNMRFSDVREKDNAEAQAAQNPANSREIMVELFDGSRYTYRIGRRPAEAVAADGESGGHPSEKADGTEKEKPKPGPVYVVVSSNEPDSEVNKLMSQHAFEYNQYVFTGLPNRERLLEMQATETGGTSAGDLMDADQPDFLRIMEASAAAQTESGDATEITAEPRPAAPSEDVAPPQPPAGDQQDETGPPMPDQNAGDAEVDIPMPPSQAEINASDGP